MTLVTSLIDIAKMVQMDLENTERQLETELKKGQAKRAFAKVGELYYTGAVLYRRLFATGETPFLGVRRVRTPQTTLN